uniref:caspase recruitment domain-containing protein 9 isoform X3 n=1 Tax=Pristiophorus japonicus TaxID=55135 RepID=UPI00398E8B7A
MAMLPDRDESDDEGLWNMLENYRARLTAVIEPGRITPYLRQCNVLNLDDEEQIFNDPNLVTRRRKVGMLLDILQRTGRKGYIAFLESLELYYPELYKRITGQDPTRTFSVILDAGGESSLTELLMAEVQKQQQTVIRTNRRLQDLTVEATKKDDLVKKLQVNVSELRKHQEGFWKMREERNNYGEELKTCKEENYKWSKDFALLSEEKNTALMRNRDLQLEIEKLKHSLMLAEDGYKVERKQTMKLKYAMEQRPTQGLILELQRENDLLKAQIQEQLCPVKYLEEKEVFELQCVTLRKDSQMYKDRIEAILVQMQEVATERDQALKMREDLHKLHSQTLQQKDEYRKLIREQGERADQLHIQLFRLEEQLLNLQAKLNRVGQSAYSSTSDFDETSPRASQDITATGLQDQDQGSAVRCWTGSEEILKGTSSDQPPAPARLAGMKTQLAVGSEEQAEGKNSRWRMKKSFEDYRRKRAIRLNKPERDQEQENWENTTGSENSDSDFSEGEGKSQIGR